MDPKACLERLLQAVSDQNDPEMVMASAELLTFLINGVAHDMVGGMTGYHSEKYLLAMSELADSLEQEED